MTRTTSIVQISSESLRGLPGYALRSLAERWLDRERLARVVDAALADVHAEWAEARTSGRHARAHWIAVRGNAALAFSLAACALSALWADLPRLASIGAGALLFPIVLFWLLAELIRSDALPGHTILVSRDIRVRPAPVIRQIPRTPRVKIVRERSRGTQIRGAGPVLVRDKAALDTAGLEGSGLLDLDLSPAPEMRTHAPTGGSEAMPLVRIPPDYPPAAARRGIQGFVVVRLWIGAGGEVARAEIAQAHPRRIFDRAALDAVRRWRYRPALTDGRAAEQGPIEVMLDFKLSDARQR